MDIETTLKIILGIIIASTPVLIIAAYKTSHIKAIFKRIDELEANKADKTSHEKTNDRLHDLEVKYAENFGRLSASIDRLERIEKRMESFFSNKKG